jgi:exodeoxyribonuclease VII large subunit
MAVPVRADLMHHLSGQGLRMERSIRRQMDLRRERLENVGRRLPGPDALLAAQRQRVDDLGGRLAQGLRHRLGNARTELAEASGALRPALLHRRLERERQRLAAVRLVAELVRRPIRERRTALEGLWRLALSLDPQRPLEKGYALVNGGAVRNAEAARAAVALTLTFADGEVDAVVGSTGKSPRAARPSKPAGQQDLFS